MHFGSLRFIGLFLETSSPLQHCSYRQSVSGSNPAQKQWWLQVPSIAWPVPSRGCPASRQWRCALLSNSAVFISPNSSTAEVGCPQGACQTVSVLSVGRRSSWSLMKKGSLKTPTSCHVITCILSLGALATLAFLSSTCPQLLHLS